MWPFTMALGSALGSGVSSTRAEALALLVRGYGYAVSEVAKYLGRDQANISTMLSRLSARQTKRSR